MVGVNHSIFGAISALEKKGLDYYDISLLILDVVKNEPEIRDTQRVSDSYLKSFRSHRASRLKSRLVSFLGHDGAGLQSLVDRAERNIERNVGWFRRSTRRPLYPHLKAAVDAVFENKEVYDSVIRDDDVPSGWFLEEISKRKENRLRLAVDVMANVLGGITSNSCVYKSHKEEILYKQYMDILEALVRK